MTIEEAIKWVKFDLESWEHQCLSYHPTKEALKMAIEALKQPEQKRGKWIRCENPMYSPFDDSDQYTYRCTVCYKKNDKQTKYCPNCGTHMEVRES